MYIIPGTELARLIDNAEHYGFIIDRTEIVLERRTVDFFGTILPYLEEEEDRFLSAFRFS